MVVLSAAELSSGESHVLSENSRFLPTTAKRWVFRELRLPVLVACLVVLGLAATAFVGTHAGTGAVSTTPTPDKPPPPPPPPAPRYVPPPPPPAPRYVPPPPPPAVAVKPKRTTVPHRRVVRRHVKQAKKKTPATVHLKAPIAAPLAPAGARPHWLVSALSAGQVDSNTSTKGVALALGGTLVLSLVLLGLALAPLRMVPRSVQGAVYERREPLLYTAGLVYLATGLSLAIALVMS